MHLLKLIAICKISECNVLSLYFLFIYINGNVVCEVNLMKTLIIQLEMKSYVNSNQLLYLLCK